MNLTRRLFAALALSLMMLLGAARPAEAQVNPTLVERLLEFEGNVKWSVVSRAWLTQRPLWIAAVRGSRTPAELGAQLLRLEMTMGWPSVNATWRARREPWIAAVRAAGTDAQAAALLGELEGVTLWTAMGPRWRSARPAWLASMQTIR